MEAQSGTEAQIHEAEGHIALISAFLHEGAAEADTLYYEGVLQDLQSQLDQLQRRKSLEMADPSGTFHNDQYTPPHDAHMAIPTHTNPLSTPNRKRSLGPADYPEPKRLSAQPSPVTPGTPVGEDAQQWTLASRPSYGGAFVDLTESDPPTPEVFLESYSNQSPANHTDYTPAGSSRPFVDLTEPDLPIPRALPDPFIPQFQANVAHAHPVGWQDPFPELDNAYREYVAYSEPADAFNTDFMGGDELASFIMSPLGAEGGYAFQQQQGNVPTIPGVVPYMPGPQRPPWAQNGSDSDDYGVSPLTGLDAHAIDKLLENIKEHGETPEDREPTPKTMCSELKEYQKIGLTWLLKMESGNAKGGILADEMGLGKTVQALSLICANPSKDPLCKTTLIIAPVALMRQWEKEIERHVHNRHALRVYLYHSGGKRADFSQLRTYDVVLTTFGTLTSEFKQKETRKESMLAEREDRDPSFRRKPNEKLALLGRECMWYRVIIDEAHNIKNRNSFQSKASADIQAKHRLCMTGTPMMNSVDELFPLLRFLRVNPYTDWPRFNSDIGKPVKSTHPDTRKRAMNRVQILLRSVMLRRQKTSVVDGQQICTIPPKHTTLANVEFSDAEHELYKALETKSQLQFNKYLERNTVSSNYANVLVLLLRLRQACCHPHLIRDLSQPATEDIAEDDLITRAEQLTQDVVNRLKASGSFECPICLEADPNPTIIIPCGHSVCGECVQKLIEPTRSGQEANEEGSAAKCPHCRGPLKAKLITDYKHFCKVYCPERLESSDEGDSEIEDKTDSDSESEDEDEDVDKRGNLAGFVVSDGEDDEYDFIESENTDPGPARDAKSSSKKLKKHRKSKGKAPAKPKKTLAQLKKDSLRNKAAKKRYLRRLEKTFVPSAKIERTVELLTDIRNNDPTEKTLIFSQFTSLLDLVEVPLMKQNIRYQRYDGSMKMDERADAVNAFMDNPHENVMLVSLKAGNAGLNLWKASQVILLDPFWNPFVEEQAIDRAHRMPQPREVKVHRVLVPETVEDRICVLQDKKREVINTALDEQTAKGLTRLGLNDLKFLFGI